MGNSTKRPPRLCTCSLTAGRKSYAETTAPKRRAVAMACSPATPQPMISTRAGVMVPAAVVSMGKILGSVSAAMSAALYPEMVAMEESASMLCARVVRGVIGVGITGCDTRASLDDHLEPALRQRGEHRGHQRHAPLPRKRFAGNTSNHEAPSDTKKQT